ncbi:MFS transporter [Heyndrickxia sp. NPDC080065]|uniref:MFS transporter n=1 Tax=Heyndrickxia sp. NPDC080065 TaxID=3390568 RepID=UPI003CFF2E6D
MKKSAEKKNVTLLFIDQMISTFASTYGTFCISWLVYELTGSKMAMGGLWFVSIFGQLIVQLFAGPFIDRWKRTTMMKLSEGLRFLAYLIAFILWTSGHINVGILYAVSFISSVVVYDSAASALIPKLAASENLVKINAKISGFVQLVRFISLPIAGFLTENLGAGRGLVLIVLLFISSLCILPFISESVSRVSSNHTWMSQFKAGIHIFRQHKMLLSLALFVVTTSFGVYATQAMYIPYVSEVLGGSSFEYSLFAAAFPFGYIIGTFIVGRLREPRKYLYAVMVLALFIGGCTYIILGLTKTIAVALFIETIAGISMPFWNVYSTTLYQRLVPETILGQVLSVRFLLTKAATPLGILYGTFCASTFSLPFLFMSVGVIICIVSGIGLFYMVMISQKIVDEKITL